MDKWLLKQAGIRYGGAMLILALLLFVPAGTLKYPGGWLFLAALFIPLLFIGLYLLKNQPQLLEKRLRMREIKPEQKKIILFIGGLFLAAVLLAGFNWRYQWIVLPLWVSLAALVVQFAGYLLYFMALRENPYASRTIQLQRRQKLVDTGVYGVVRHPMYLSTVLLFLSMPLILASFLSFVVMLLYLPALEWRMRSEESMLEKGLPGYLEYEERVKYKVIPYFW